MSTSVVAALSSRFSAAVTGVILGISVLGSGVNAPAQAVTTSVTCPSDPAPLTATDANKLWALAERKLTAAATGSTSRYPFGAREDATSYTRSSVYGWTSGFFPAELWLMAAHTSDPTWQTKARAWTKHLLALQHYTGSHDLGFMLGLPLGLGMELDATRAPTYRRGYINAAQSLSKRWNHHVGAMKSGEYSGKWGVIIDSSMNMPLLLHAAELTQDPKLSKRLTKRALSHDNVLATHFIRVNGSTVHRGAFNPRTGRFIGAIAGQGLAPHSTWARGQAWAIAGFAQAYAITHRVGQLNNALNVAEYWIANVPAGCVPAWDLDVTSDDAPRDASAAAIAAYGFLVLADELDALEPASGSRYRAYALRTLGTLASSEWTTENSSNPGILQRATYNVPADAREGSYVWGDYYLLAAVARAQGEQVSVP